MEQRPNSASKRRFGTAADNVQKHRLIKGTHWSIISTLHDSSAGSGHVTPASQIERVKLKEGRGHGHRPTARAGPGLGAKAKPDCEAPLLFLTGLHFWPKNRMLSNVYTFEKVKQFYLILANSIIIITRRILALEP